MKAIDGPETQADERSLVGRAQAPVPGPRPEAAGPAVVLGSDPRLVHGPGAAAGLMALQRTAGNAAVATLVGSPPSLQRQVAVDEVASSAAGAGGAAAPSPATASAGLAAGSPTAGSPTAGSPVTSDGATTTITGAQITLEAPMTTAAGVLRADTLIVDSVIASSYSPGAGNVW